VILLVTHGHPTMVRHRSPHLGRLVQPRHYSAIEQTAAAGIPWAADNDCFQRLDEPAWLDMLDRLAGLPGCLFAVVPDVVGDPDANDDRWIAYAGEVARRGLPPAYALQDGCRGYPDDAAAVFIGGSTEYKLSRAAAELVACAHRDGRWTHMGRVNGARRMRYAASLGTIESVDGSSWARWEGTWLRAGVTMAGAPAQMRMEDT